jgi:hypothetical protein
LLAGAGGRLSALLGQMPDDQTRCCPDQIGLLEYAPPHRNGLDTIQHGP